MVRALGKPIGFPSARPFSSDWPVRLVFFLVPERCGCRKCQLYTVFVWFRTKSSKNPRENQQIQNIQTRRNLRGARPRRRRISCAWFGYFGYFGFPEGFASSTASLVFCSIVWFYHVPAARLLKMLTLHSVCLVSDEKQQKPSGKPKNPKYPNQAQLTRSAAQTAPHKLRMVWICEGMSIPTGVSTVGWTSSLLDSMTECNDRATTATNRSANEVRLRCSEGELRVQRSTTALQLK